MTTLPGRGVLIAPNDSASPEVVPLLLLVDPDDDARARCAGALATAGFRLAHARTGFEAIVKTSCYRPDLIVMRTLLPGPDGLDGRGTVELLRSCPATAHIPILLETRARCEHRLLRKIEGVLTKRSLFREHG